MSVVNVIVPDLGVDTGDAVVISAWFSSVGDEVIEGDRLVELLAGNTTFDVAAPANGRLAEVRLAEDDAVRTGDVLGVIDVEEVTGDE